MRQSAFGAITQIKQYPCGPLHFRGVISLEKVIIAYKGDEKTQAKRKLRTDEWL